MFKYIAVLPFILAMVDKQTIVMQESSNRLFFERLENSGSNTLSLWGNSCNSSEEKPYKCSFFKHHDLSP